jgi:hypothetical protein
LRLSAQPCVPDRLAEEAGDRRGLAEGAKLRLGDDIADGDLDPLPDLVADLVEQERKRV